MSLSVKREKIKQMYENGESTWSIAKIFGVYPSTIKWHLKRAGVVLRSKSAANKLAFQRGRIKIFAHSLPAASAQLTKEKAYILGVLCGDAWYWIGKRSWQIGLAATDRDFVETFADCLERTYEIKPSMKALSRRNPMWNKQFETKLCSKAVVNDVLSYGVNFRTVEWRVPDAIAKAHLDIQSVFIRGYFDSEGCVEERRVQAASTNVAGLSEIQTLLRRFDIRSSLTLQVHTESNRKPSFTLRIQDRKSVENYHKFIGFGIIRKQVALKNVISSYKLLKSLRDDINLVEPKMVQLRSEGFSYSQIAKTVNVSIGTVWRHLNRNTIHERLAP